MLDEAIQEEAAMPVPSRHRSSPSIGVAPEPEVPQSALWARRSEGGASWPTERDGRPLLELPEAPAEGLFTAQDAFGQNIDYAFDPLTQAHFSRPNPRAPSPETDPFEDVPFVFGLGPRAR